MIRQNALHISAAIRKGQLGALTSFLYRIGQSPETNCYLPFGQLADTHFARLVIVPGAYNRKGEWLPDTLVLATNFDGKLTAHLNNLLDVADGSSAHEAVDANAPNGLDALFEHCVAYPPQLQRNRESRLAFLRDHATPVAAHYVNTRGRSLDHLAREAELYTALQDMLAQRAGQTTAALLYRDLRKQVGEQEALRWALSPEGDTSGHSGRRLRLVLAGLAGIAALILAVLVVPWLLFVFALVFLVVLRAHEIGNLPDNYRPPNSRIAARQDEEERQTQNQLSSTGFVQSGWFRHGLLRVCLWILDFGNRNIFYRGHLAGVDTIHFARWVMLDGYQRVLFFSNFDGSPESYQDDFIERVAFGLNLVFSNGAGWPATRFLLFGGSRDEQAFRAFYRDHQIPTQVWYVAPPYQGATAVNLARNARVRAGLGRELHGRELEEWLQLL